MFKQSTKIAALFSNPISYKTAFALSVLFHGLVFILLALLLNPLKLSNLHKIPLIIDFVSMPGNEKRGVSSQAAEDIIEQSFQEYNFIPADSYSETSLIQSIQDESSTNEIQDASQISEYNTPTKLVQPYFASVFVPPSIKFPRIEIAKPKLMPAKMPLSERHEKTLLKQVTKLTEKLNEKELPDTTLVFEDKNQKFELKIQHLPARSATELDEVLFDITTEQNGELLSAQMRMRRLAFSNFAQLVDNWDPQVAVHDDVFEGRFHTNYAFVISRNKGIGPQFHGKV
ncbi:MAG: hypothetical protein JSW07_06210, partial [bacterium]